MEKFLGVRTFAQRLLTDSPSVTFLNFTSPMMLMACPIEFTVPRHPYNDEFTKRRIFPARRVSFSISDASFAKETSSFARLPSSRFSIGERGGNSFRLLRAFSRHAEEMAVPVITSISARRDIS